MGAETVRLGSNELLIRLASGGAANVFLVRELEGAHAGRLLALKILLPQLSANEDFLRMFFSEARIASRLSHENIVAIAGFGQVQGIHCMAMEYVFGASLSQVLRASARARKPLTVGVLLRITASVCDALHFAHELLDENGAQLGLVHRDVTPQNILIGFNGIPKLTDFGIAKATNRGWETQAGIVKGKFSYMSPEQALGKMVDRRSDIFGAGIVLWEALTGRDLFRGTTPMEVLTAIQEQKIVPPSKVVPGLTPIVDPIVMKALRRSPRSRYATAAEMKADIEELITKAGVQIDKDTISREFASIYGPEIAERAVALRAAMDGHADVEHLAKVLGGQVLNPKHLPIVAGGLNDPDPLGLFSEHTPPADRVERGRAPEGSLLPARPEKPFTSTFTAEDIEVVESVESEVEDIRALETAREAPPSSTDSILDSRDIEGWNDATSRLVPEDELLSLLSEGDVKKGVVPPTFAERFEEKMPTVSNEGGKARFGEEEATLGMGASFRPADVRELERRLPPRPKARDIVPVRSIPRAPSLDLDPDHARRSSHRPLPRAPSLDMDGELTPQPVLGLGHGRGNVLEPIVVSSVRVASLSKTPAPPRVRDDSPPPKNSNEPTEDPEAVVPRNDTPSVARSSLEGEPRSWPPAIDAEPTPLLPSPEPERPRSSWSSVITPAANRDARDEAAMASPPPASLSSLNLHGPAADVPQSSAESQAAFGPIEAYRSEPGVRIAPGVLFLLMVGILGVGLAMGILLERYGLIARVLGP
ncbi:MAG: protein kinase [Deltaproteobacteria bacterium]|nr:protein kinase [Deltaproteobacteria bacterium]